MTTYFGDLEDAVLIENPKEWVSHGTCIVVKVIKRGLAAQFMFVNQPIRPLLELVRSWQPDHNGCTEPSFRNASEDSLYAATGRFCHGGR